MRSVIIGDAFEWFQLVWMFGLSFLCTVTWCWISDSHRLIYECLKKKLCYLKYSTPFQFESLQRTNTVVFIYSLILLYFSIILFILSSPSHLISFSPSPLSRTYLTCRSRRREFRRWGEETGWYPCIYPHYGIHFPSTSTANWKGKQVLKNCSWSMIVLHVQY